MFRLMAWVYIKRLQLDPEAYGKLENGSTSSYRLL